MHEDAEQVWAHGKYLISIEYYSFKINLYSVGEEFYEIFYNPNTNEIEKVNCAGLILVRKRPGTAKGICFITL